MASGGGGEYEEKKEGARARVGRHRLRPAGPSLETVSAAVRVHWYTLL